MLKILCRSGADGPCNWRGWFKRLRHAAAIRMRPLEPVDQEVRRRLALVSLKADAVLEGALCDCGTYVAVAVPFESINSMKKSLEVATGLSLRDRGEAHLTIFSPPEWAMLRSRGISFDTLQRFVSSMGLLCERLAYRPLFLGGIQAGRGRSACRTFFLVVDIPEVFALRRRVWQEIDLVFPVESLFPHITIGFSHCDLHPIVGDSVQKDRRSHIIDVGGA